MRDFPQLLKGVSFWDQEVTVAYQKDGVTAIDFVAQIREEILALCEWIEAQHVRSYLEIGIWTGGLISALHEIFRFQRVAACDLGTARLYDLQIKLKREVAFFEGNSRSPIYLNWRHKLGHIDLTLIDASHQYEEVKRDFEINRGFPHKYIAFHGIAGGALVGDDVKRFWDELEGNKVEILRPHTEIGLEHSTMGIGIWSAS